MYLFILHCFEIERYICLPYPPTSPNCYLPKSGRHLTSLDQSLSSSEARSGKSLGTRLATNLFPVVDKFEISCYHLVIWLS